MNLPNLLTLIRILLAPVLLVVFYLPVDWSHVAAALIFAFAAMTDWLDGYLARHWKQTSPFGAFLDPVADKLIVVVALVLVVGEKQLYFLTVPAVVIVGRELVISALREWMAELGKRMSVAVTQVGKFKTMAQLAALTLLLVYKPGYSSVILFLGYVLFYLSAVLTLWSMVMYLKVAWPDLTLGKDS